MVTLTVSLQGPASPRVFTQFIAVGGVVVEGVGVAESSAAKELPQY